MGIIGRFTKRIETLVTTKEDKKVEEAHVKKAPKQCISKLFTGTLGERGICVHHCQ